MQVLKITTVFLALIIALLGCAEGIPSPKIKGLGFLKESSIAKLANTLRDLKRHLPQIRDVDNNVGEMDWPAYCKTPRCVDYVKKDEECCPECPRGGNCYYNNQIIDGNQYVIVSNSGGCQRICICPSERVYTENGINTQADCYDTCK